MVKKRQFSVVIRMITNWQFWFVISVVKKRNFSVNVTLVKKR